MSSILRAILVVVVCFVSVSNVSAWQLVGNFFNNRDFHETPMAIGLDKVDRLVIGGNWKMEFRRLSPEEDPTHKRGLLVVRIKGEDGNFAERFLAYSVDAGGSKDVRLVTEKGPGCFWTKTMLQEKKLLRESSASGRRIREMQMRWEFFYWPSEGQLMGKELCADEDKSLVLGASPSTRRVGNVKEFVYDDDPNDGK